MGIVKEYIGTYEYYMCRDMFRGRLKTCENTKRLKKKDLEKKIEELIYILKDRNIFEKKYYKSEVNNPAKELKELELNMKKLDKTINNLTDKIALLSNDAAMILIDKIETLVKEKKVLKDKMIKIELESLDNIDGKEEFIYENILEFNTNLSVDQKRNIAINIFKEIVYDYKTDKFEVFFN